MTETQLTREEELVAYFVNRCDDGRLGRTRLMKLLYLADYEARRFLGRPISGIDYIWHFYGPYTHDLPKWTSDLESKGVIVEDPVIYPSGKSGVLYHAGARRVTPSFTPAEAEVLAYVCDEYSSLELRELLDDVVYQTEPMLDAQQRDAKGAALRMNLVDNARSRELGASFEEVLERSRRLCAGEFMGHADAMRAVLNELVNA